MNQQQYTTFFNIGARLLASFDSTMAKAQARLKSLQKAATEVADKLRFLKTAMTSALAGLATFAAGAVFKKIFSGAFEEAAAAQQRMLSVTNEFWIHMRKQGRDAAAKQTEMLFAYNKELAKTGVLSHMIYDTLTVGLSKIGLSSREIAEMNPVLADVLVRARGIRASTEDATDLADTLVKVAKGGRQIALLKFGILLGPSERARLKAYKDDWRGALDYLFFFLKTYKGFNQEAARTPLGQIQRMRNLFDEFSETIGNTMLPAQADMAAAWEKALPAVEPAILGALKAIATIITFLVTEIGEFYERVQMPDAVAALNELKQAFVDLWTSLGLEVPEAGFFGRLIGGAFIASCKLLAWEIHNIELVVKVLGAVFNFVFGDAIKAFHRMSEELNAMGKVWRLVKAWVTEALFHPIDAAFHRLQDLLALLHIIKKPSKQTTEALTGMPVAAQGFPTELPPVPEWVKKNPQLLKAYMAGAAPAAVPQGGNYPTPAYDRPGGYGYGPQRPPPMPAVTAPPVPVSRPPAIPAVPTTRIWSPAGAGGGAGMIPAGATMPYGGAPPYGGAVGGAGFGVGGAGVPSIPSTGGGGAAAAVAPDSAAAAKAQADIASAAQGQPSSLTAQQQKGSVLYGKLLAQFREHPPQGVPPDAARFGISKGTPEEWARWGVSVAHAESGFNPKSTNLTDPGGSFGVFQYSHGQAYGNAYDVDNSVRAFVRDANEAAKSASIRGSILGERFSTIGKHPDVGTAYLAGAQKIAQASAPPAASAPPPLIAAAYQRGGIARTPQLATLAEAGPEMVLPMGGRGALGMFSSLLGGLRGMAGGGDTHHYNFNPSISIAGNADERTTNEMDIKLRHLAREFVHSFKEAQRQERRLSYESGYGS